MSNKNMRKFLENVNILYILSFHSCKNFVAQDWRESPLKISVIPFTNSLKCDSFLTGEFKAEIFCNLIPLE